MLTGDGADGGPTRVDPDQGLPERVPPLVGVAWALLLANTLGYTSVDLNVPFSRSTAQLVTMGSLIAAFTLALLLNPRVRLRPSPALAMLTLLVVVSLASSIRLEAGLGSIARCGRFLVFVATLWLLSAWWRGDLLVVRNHLRALCAIMSTVLVGLIISPAAAFSGPDDRLVGAIWPIPAPQVGMCCALTIGLVALLWLHRYVDGRAALLIIAPAIMLLLLSHTRTALMALCVGLALVTLTLVPTNARARRFLLVGGGLGGLVALAFGSTIQFWLTRGQDSEELANFTGRAKVWDALLATDRTLTEQLLGVGLGDKSFNGLPIDNAWLSIYYEQGWLGVAVVTSLLLSLLAAAVLRPPSPQRACGLFLVLYCILASYTEVGLGDASPYILSLTVAGALLHPAGPRAAQLPTRLEAPR